MALQAARPPTDSNEFRRSELLKRLAESHARAEARRSPSRAHRAPVFDPAEYLGVSPPVMLTICAQVGAALGLLVYGTFQIAAGTEPVAAPPQAVAIEPGTTTAAGPSTFVAVAELPEPAQVIDDYYFFLRQGMYDRAWEATDDAFRRDYYAASFEAYQQTWADAQAMEVLRLDLVWQDGREAHVLGEIQEGASGLRWRNSYVLRFDETTSSWKIHAVAPAG